MKGMLTILVVDDEPLSRQLLTFELERWGTLIAASDGNEALWLCNATNLIFDIVITDYVMPHLNGREFVEILRAEHGTLPIVLLSAVQQSDDLLDWCKRYDVICLEKSSDFTALHSLCARVAEGKTLEFGAARR
jgi:CheY-like chemotaxis protein